MSDDSEDQRKTKSTLERTAAVIIASASLALGIAGAFVAWRDYVHAYIGDVAKSVAVLEADFESYNRERAFHIARIDKLESKLEVYSATFATFAERLVRCEDRREPKQ